MKYYDGMKSDKTNAVIFLVLAIILLMWSRQLIFDTYGHRTSHSIEGNGVLAGTIGFVTWVWGFVLLARSKGRSELLAILLSLFSFVGLANLLLLRDIKK